MGKSTGKWIKTVLFGKKSAKSSISKKEEINRPSDDEAENPSLVSDQASHNSETNRGNSQLETGVSENLPHNAIVSLPATQDAHREGTMELDSEDSFQIAMQEHAATKAQAAFRGYLARRAFNALKGIIVLQALIRGDLLRKRASANLLCQQGQPSSCQTELVPEQSQNEIEKVRRKLRRVSRSGTEAPEKSETATLREKQSPRKLLRSSVADVPKTGVHGSSENKRGPPLSVLKDFKKAELQTTPKSYTAEKTLDVVDGDNPRENCHDVEKAPLVDEELNSTDDQIYQENTRTRRLRSFPVKEECEENVSYNPPTLPSYMAATESAKAKLRSERSPKFQDDNFEDVYERRHSLPFSANGRLSSMSSRMQKEVQQNGKGGNKNVKSKVSSSNGEKVARAGWKR